MKTLVIEGTLTRFGRTIGTFEARRRSCRGSLRACTTVRDLSEDIADDLLRRLPQPSMNAGCPTR